MYLNSLVKYRKINKFFNVIINPLHLYRLFIKKTNCAKFETKVILDAFFKPHYAYCLHQAVKQAIYLSYKEISVIEFGVAGGNGLIELENIAIQAEKEYDIKINIYGFDLGIGMPEPSDYKDLPYIWNKGFYEMEVDKLKSKLKKAQLILGNVSQTVNTFFDKYNPPPIGFIAFDLDYYSSTRDALKIYQNNDKYFLPRVFNYFDDCIGEDVELHSEFTGELLAIKEYNDYSINSKLAAIYGLKYKRVFPNSWNELIYITHFLNHKDYNTFINYENNSQLPLIL